MLPIPKPWMHSQKYRFIQNDAPDMSGVNAAAQQNAEIGREQLGLAREQYADSKARAEEYDPIFKQLIQSNLDQQKTSSDQSAAQWKSYTDLFQPAEAKLATTAMNFDTPERREAEAAKAGSDVAQQFSLKDAALRSDMGRANVTLSSGKGLALAAGSKLDAAKATASAENNARKNVEATGLSLVDNAARFGRNMPSTGIATAAQSLAAGQGAGNTIGQQTQNINAGLSGAQGFYSGATGATASAGSLSLGAANLQNQVSQQNNAGLSSLLGTAAKAGLGFATGGLSGILPALAG